MQKPVDFYIRTKEDVNYREGVLETGNPLEIFISKIKMILNTNPGEILGFPEFGAGLEQVLFDMNVDVEVIKIHIQKQIEEYCKESVYFDTNVDIKFFKGTIRDWVLVDIFIDGTKEFGVIIK